VLAINTFGEIWIRSEQCTEGYWNRPEDTASLLPGDGWLRTGDAGHINDDGYIFITDRIKDMIISGGENVYPAEVERVLVEHPSVSEVCVIGAPDEKWGEAVTAVVVLKPGATISPDELIAWARPQLAGFRRPRRVDFVPALPRNPAGKILKRAVREPYWAGRDHVI
jgi:long-chain acyl-CoA synthetase